MGQSELQLPYLEMLPSWGGRWGGGARNPRDLYAGVPLKDYVGIILRNSSDGETWQEVPAGAVNRVIIPPTAFPEVSS